MINLAILIENPLIIGKFEGDLSQSVRLQGNLYGKRFPKELDVIFYDWLFDERGFVRGLEIHVEPQHPLFRSKVHLGNIQQIELDSFVRIWFQDVRNATSAGLEAFDDIFFFEGPNSALAIMVGTDWLSPKQTEELLAKLPVIAP